VYNAISNGGNIPNQWRTLTRGEWIYVFNSRSTPSGIRYAKGIVNGVNGVILLPDDWSSSVYALNYTNRYEAPFNINEITSENWSMMEAQGAVFLPAAGYRLFGTWVSGVNSDGSYWSSSCCNGDYAYYVRFNDSHFDIYYNYMVNDYRNSGQSVRLVATP
jgi:hypothetical protein